MEEGDYSKKRKREDPVCVLGPFPIYRSLFLFPSFLPHILDPCLTLRSDSRDSLPLFSFLYYLGRSRNGSGSCWELWHDVEKCLHSMGTI